MPRNLLAVDDAIAQIALGLPKMATEMVALTHADGRVLSQAVHATTSHPPARVSAMDGYAARSVDLKKLPTTLTVIGTSTAGTPCHKSIGEGECIRIFTGAHCPDGSDTIILQEDASVKDTSAEDTASGSLTPDTASASTADATTVTIRDAPDVGRYIRPKGTDFTEGQRLFDAGTRLTPRSLALIGLAGHSTVPAYRKPRIAILSTGDELVEVGTPPKPHQIISSNGIFLEKLVQSLGGMAYQLGIIADDDTALNTALNKTIEQDTPDLIVTSGGASVGAHDGIARKMQKDSDLAFWRIAMRPGKPLIFGHIKGAKTPLLGLPGNPVSTAVCGVVFVASAIRAMLGQNPNLPYRTALLGNDLPANDDRQAFLRARLDYGDNATITATAFDRQDSALMTGFAYADALIMRPPNAPHAKKGATVPFLALTA